MDDELARGHHDLCRMKRETVTESQIDTEWLRSDWFEAYQDIVTAIGEDGVDEEDVERLRGRVEQTIVAALYTTVRPDTAIGGIMTPEQLSEAHGGVWGHHPAWPVSAWTSEVENGDTRQGYWEWVAKNIEVTTARAV